MAQFFINRPIFAWVIAIIIMLGGALSIVTLPLEQYPDIAPPRVTIGHQIRCPGPIVFTRCMIASYAHPTSVPQNPLSLAPRFTSTFGGSHPCDRHVVIQFDALYDAGTPKAPVL